RPLECLERPGIDVLQHLAEELTEDSASVDAERQDAGERPEPYHEDEDERPHDLGNGPQHVQQSLTERVDRDAQRPGDRTERPAFVEDPVIEERPRGDERERQADDDRQERADQRDRERLERPHPGVAHRRRGGVGGKEPPDIRRDLAEALAAEEAAEVHAGAMPRPDQQAAEAGAHPQRRRPAAPHGRHAHHHTTHARMRPLMKSTVATSTKRIASSVSTSSNWNIRMESSICWPSPPAPTKPRRAEARMAHSQRKSV